MKIGKGSHRVKVVCLMVLAVTISIWLYRADGLQASEESPSLTTRLTAVGDQLRTEVVIPNPDAGEYTLIFENLQDVSVASIQTNINEEFTGQVMITDGEAVTAKKVRFTGEDIPTCTLTFDVQQQYMDQESSIMLQGPTGNTLLKQKLEFRDITTFTMANGIQTRAWSGADVFPDNTVSLSDVFRPAIGSGPNLLNDGHALQIVGATSQTGAIWSKRKINLLRDFEFTAYIYLGNGRNGTTMSNSDVADGITMVFQNDGRMVDTPETVIGPGGAALGVYSVNSANSNNYIRNAIALEFDPYNNGSIDTSVSGSGGHIAVMVPAGRNDQSAYRTHHGLLRAPTTNSSSAADRMSNDTWRALTIFWDAASQTLNYTIDDFGSASYTVSNLQTTFGGTSAYWGFTGATGSLMMDARIAMKEIPGNAAHDLKVENVTRLSQKATSVQGFKNDLVRFTDTIEPDSDAVLSGDGASIKITLPTGLDYQNGTLTFDGAAVDESQITVSGQTITISDLAITTSRDYALTFDATVTSNDVNVSLATTTEVISKYGSSWGTSDEAIVTIPNMGQVTFHYVDADGTPIKTPLTLYQEFGTNFDEKPVTIPYYTYDRTVGNATGTVNASEQDVYFYYNRNQVDLTVQFLDEGGEALHSAVTLPKDVVSTVDLTEETAITDVITSLLGQYYEVVSRPTNETSLAIAEENLTVFYVLRLSTAVVTVEFVNELDQVLPGYTVAIDTFVGETLDLTQETTVTDQLENLNNAGYQVVTRPANETNVMVNSREMTVQYKIQGLLSLTSAPKLLDFGSLTYNAQKQRVENPAISGGNLVVTDTRADRSDGWTVTLALSSPMKNNSGQELVNALRYVYKGDETILSNNAVPVYLNTSGQTGTFNISDTWGTASGTDGVKLQIGSADVVYTGEYVGVVTWTVMAGQP